ncbi:MAG TPA: nucleotidyltransferase domain-containing protein [Rhodanobacteraceae bacterium]|nr:nucleotidyltransferase domain-containing protein [Rhodanobacteraceae bacterium]
MPELSANDRAIVKQILQRHFPDRKVHVFGSRAHGRTKPWSDLDLAILGEAPLDDLPLAEARADFEESDLPFQVDLVPLRDLPQSLKENVLRHGMPL